MDTKDPDPKRRRVKAARTYHPSQKTSPSRPEQLRQLVRNRGVHLAHVKVIEILGTASCLSLGQHPLDERRELDCADRIVVKYLCKILFQA